MGAHILIVDGDASAAEVTKAGIRRALPDASLAVAANPDQGWECVQERRPDVLIVDPSPHCLGSAWMVRALKREAPEARVIVLTSAALPYLDRLMRQIGVDVHLNKPVALVRLIDEVRGVLRTTESSTV
jgi:DNA-binding response OmpR family regulator